MGAVEEDLFDWKPFGGGRVPRDEREGDKENSDHREIRPSEVRMTELEPETGKVHFYSGHKVISGSWLGSRSLEDWPKIFAHMKKSMNPNWNDVNGPKLKWAPKP